MGSVRPALGLARKTHLRPAGNYLFSLSLQKTEGERHGGGGGDEEEEEDSQILAGLSP